jgi:hypothetical protein
MSQEGGELVRFINGCVGNSVKGTIVSLDPTADRTVAETALTTTGCIGVIAEDGIAVGADVWVAINGIAEVNFNDNVGTPGEYVRIPVAGDAAIAVQEVIELQITGPAAAVAGTLGVKLPSLASVPVVITGGEAPAAVAALIAAEAFAGWVAGAIGDTVTFTQAVGATTDGLTELTAGTTTIVGAYTVTATGKPAITPAAGVAVADPALPADGVQIGLLLEDHTARSYADGVNPAKVLLRFN